MWKDIMVDGTRMGEVTLVSLILNFLSGHLAIP